MLRRQPEKEYKCCVIFYHQNLKGKYKQEWMSECVESIEKQTYKNFDVLELNYGTTLDKLKDLIGRPAKFPNQYLTLYKKQKNHIHAMNYLLDYAFNNLEYDVVFNTNLDDKFHQDRFIKQLEYVKSEYELVSSNFIHIDENNTIKHLFKMSELNIKDELNRDHNILAHPVITFTKEFWNKYKYYEDRLQVEDLLLWKKAINNNAKIAIVPEYLLMYRLHPQQITAENRK